MDAHEDVLGLLQPARLGQHAPDAVGGKQIARVLLEGPPVQSHGVRQVADRFLVVSVLVQVSGDRVQVDVAECQTAVDLDALGLGRERREELVDALLRRSEVAAIDVDAGQKTERVGRVRRGLGGLPGPFLGAPDVPPLLADARQTQLAVHVLRELLEQRNVLLLRRLHVSHGLRGARDVVSQRHLREGVHVAQLAGLDALHRCAQQVERRRGLPRPKVQHRRVVHQTTRRLGVVHLGGVLGRHLDVPVGVVRGGRAKQLDRTLIRLQRPRRILQAHDVPEHLPQPRIVVRLLDHPRKLFHHLGALLPALEMRNERSEVARDIQPGRILAHQLLEHAGRLRQVPPAGQHLRQRQPRRPAALFVHVDRLAITRRCLFQVPSGMMEPTDRRRQLGPGGDVVARDGRLGHVCKLQGLLVHRLRHRILRHGKCHIRM